MFTNHMYLIYMYEQDLPWNNLQCLIWHKNQTNEHFTYKSHIWPFNSVQTDVKSSSKYKITILETI